MPQYVDPNLIRTQQMRADPLNFSVVFVMNKPAHKLRFPSSKAETFVIPKTLLGTPPEGSKSRRIIVDDFVKEVTYESTSVQNQEWPQSNIGAEPIRASITLDNRFGRFNYIPIGTLVQLSTTKNGKKRPFLTTYVWNVEKTANGPSEDIVLTCVDLLFWLSICDVDITLKPDNTIETTSTSNRTLQDIERESQDTTTTDTTTPTDGTTTTTNTTSFLGARKVLSRTARPDVFIKQVAKAHKIPLGRIPRTKTRITCPMDFPTGGSTTVLGFIMKILELTKTAEGRVTASGETVDIAATAGEDATNVNTSFRSDASSPGLIQKRQGKDVQFDVHARNRKLNIIPIRKPTATTKIFRFTDAAMVRTGIKLTESYPDDQKFATRFFVVDEVETQTITGSDPGSYQNTGSGGGGNSPGPTDPLGKYVYTSPPVNPDGQDPPKGQQSYFVSSGGLGPPRPARVITFIYAGNDASVVSNLVLHGTKAKRDSRLRNIVRIADGVGGKNWYKFPDVPGSTSPTHPQQLITTKVYLVFYGVVRGGETHADTFDGTFMWRTYTRRLRSAPGARRSAPDEVEPSDEAAAQTRTRATGSSRPPTNPVPNTTTSYVWVDAGVDYPSFNGNFTSIPSWHQRNFAHTLIAGVSSASDSRLYSGRQVNKVGNQYVASFSSLPGLKFYGNTLLDVGTNSPFQSPVNYLKWNGFFSLKHSRKKTSTSTGGTTPTTPGGAGGTELVDPDGPQTTTTTKKKLYTIVNPKNKNIQKAFGIVARRFELSAYTGCSEDNSLKHNLKVKEAKKRIEDAWRPQYTLSFTTSGILGIWANSHIYVNSRSTTVNGLFLVKSIKYSITKRQIVMSIELDVTRKSIISPSKFEAGRNTYLRY